MLRDRRVPWSALALAGALALAAGCSTRGPLVRKLFYPPVYGPFTELQAADQTPGGTFDYSAYRYLLSRAVQPDGRVDYGALQTRREELEAFNSELAGVELGALSRFDRLALLLNAYNSFTLQLMLENEGVASIMDIPARRRWKPRRWVVGAEHVSLLDLEHRKIREAFREPRVHFALVCASSGCPALRAEPYTGARLLEQLDDQARHFFSKPGNLRWDGKTKTLYLSELLDWYRDDFGGAGAALVGYVLDYAEPGVAAEVRAAGNAVTLGWLPYDWSLNGHW